MRRLSVLLLLGFLAGISSGQGILGNGWMDDLMKSINQLNANIQGNVQRITGQIQESVNGHLAQIDRINNEFQQEMGQHNYSTTNFTKVGPAILINNAGGTSRTIFSGHGANGEPYFRDTEDRVVGDILHHTERVYNPTTKTMNEYSYTLDLKDPKAKPIPV